MLLSLLKFAMYYRKIKVHTGEGKGFPEEVIYELSHKEGRQGQQTLLYT